MKGFMVCCDEKGNEKRTFSLLKLPIKESVIVKKSIELYKEPEPCVIYRTIIVNKMGLETLPKLEEAKVENQNLKIEDARRIIGDILELSEDIKTLRFF